ncbi:UDP-glucose 4-epimerase GalE [Oxalobacter vibrioformis]|uniref:UDP-glucose 4-epimerase n=1 Tax=Oxalobacter vibrioformis TaxID=933080 RepID=A0A9E9LYG4_9BURK|nr:UDP-glucose 4-epimerase GalE [Oxalobacter vibrioformis]NLC22968.1 UDP-glucose 4-epimerase GalE [Oxalobacter sp.]WAW09774.1 UDP-glucose 4-epimerase GalE [Oxalobacter vibrioformis]
MILVTGACGYIGSHTCIELLERGYPVLAIDNYANSSREALFRVEEITDKGVAFHQCDIRDRMLLNRIFSDYSIDGVIHFAGIKASGEYLSEPLRYFSVNVGGTVTLMQALSDAGVKHMLYSSSANMYGQAESAPVSESARLSAANPYGRSKLMAEVILADLVRADPNWSIGVLRYFNPAGAHPSGRIGEDPKDIPNNIMFYAAQVAAGELDKLTIFGDDYPTEDGTQVSDYLHVMDLARGHVDALAYLFTQGKGFTVNLGSGKGYSVLEIIRAFERVTGLPIPYEIKSRKVADTPVCIANPSLATSLFGWKAEHTLDEMCTDYWRWVTMNPNGYKE